MAPKRTIAIITMTIKGFVNGFPLRVITLSIKHPLFVFFLRECQRSYALLIHINAFS
jgi:hypothetical protein